MNASRAAAHQPLRDRLSIENRRSASIGFSRAKRSKRKDVLGYDAPQTSNLNVHWPKCDQSFIISSHPTTITISVDPRERTSVIDSAAAGRLTYRKPCAQCGDLLIAPEWSEHVSERCIRHVWACEACGYEFETAVYLRAETPGTLAAHGGRTLRTSLETQTSSHCVGSRAAQLVH